MPPRYAYWTILIDDKPTAFRARVREELLPTLHQLRRTNDNVALRWFARGRLWDTPEQAEWARRNVPKAGAQGRGRDWRPGGAHKDPRARFARKKDTRHARPAAPKGSTGAAGPVRRRGPSRPLNPGHATGRPPRRTGPPRGPRKPRS